MTKYILDIRRAFRFQQHPFKKFDHLEKNKTKKNIVPILKSIFFIL